MYVIKVLGRADLGTLYERDLWLRYNDTEANGGRGHVQLTPTVHEAQRFETQDDAYVEWRKQSSCVPLRPDGRPNRPLTAFHVAIEHVPTH